ncbi:MAG: helicase HerA domain-containing protein [Candidatus Thorarchaeota archaeon]
MSEENESSPFMSWAAKGILVLFATFLQSSAVFVLLMLVPWMPSSIAGPTLLISAVIFLAGNAVLLESKDTKMWIYSVAAGFGVGIGSITLATLWMLTYIPVPIVGNAFYAVMIVIAIIGFSISWVKTSPTRELHTGAVAVSPSNTSSQTSLSVKGIFQKKPEQVLFVELKEIPHDYAFSENSKYTPLEIVQRFTSVTRSMVTTPYGFRLQRENWNTRIFYFTWASDEVILQRQMAVLNDALQHNLPGFRLEPAGNFSGVTLQDDERGSAGIITGIPLSVQEENQLKDPLEVMTGVLQTMESGVYQVFIEPMTVNKSKLRSLERQYKQALERSETTVSKEKSGWLGTHQESKIIVNYDAKKKAELLERQIRRWSNTDLFKTTVSVVTWDKDVTKTDFEVRRLISPLLGSIRSDNTQDALRFELTTKSKYINRLLAGLPYGNSSVLTAEEVTAYTIISRKDADVRVTKREKFSSGTKETVSTPEPTKEEIEMVTSLVPSKVSWLKRNPTVFLGNPIDESGGILDKSYVTCDFDFFKMHFAVLGHTQSGKSTTIRSIFGQAVTLDVNPIMLSPIRSYESRLFIHLFDNTRIFTCGRRDLVSLLFNLWNPPKNVPLSKWVDRMVQAWTLWLPNEPVISMHFEKVVFTMYKKCDWDINNNLRGRPILISDLIEALEIEEQRLHYADEVSSNVFGILVERIRSILRRYNLVGIFNTKTGISVEELLSQPTIIDMDALSGTDQILLMGVLTAAICEYKLSNPTKDVTNILILEEAHYLLSGSDSSGEAHSGARIQAIEAFTEMLRVVGGTGLGVMLADQSPTSLAPQIMKIIVNMIVHALPDDADRKLVGRHTRCTEAQMDHIGGMGIGEVVVYLQHEGEPKHVKMFTLDRFIKEEIPDEIVSDKVLAKHMKAIVEKYPHLEDIEPLPDDSGEQFKSRKKVKEDHVNPIEAEILRILKVPVIANFVKDALQKEDYPALSKQLRTIVNTHGDGRSETVLLAFKLLMQEYGNQGNIDRFDKLSKFLDGESDT